MDLDTVKMTVMKYKSFKKIKTLSQPTEASTVMRFLRKPGRALKAKHTNAHSLASVSPI